MLRCLFIPCALIAASGHCASSRVGEVEVREGHAGAPCFTISQAEQERGGAPHFQSISVREDGSLGRTAAAWRMEMPRQRTFAVTYRMCIPYAGRLPVLPQTSAAPLKAGQLYEVVLGARAPLAKDGPRSYRGWFCMEADGQGVLRARGVGYRHDRTCRRSVASL